MQSKSILIYLMVGLFSQQGLSADVEYSYFVCTLARGDAPTALTIEYSKKDSKHAIRVLDFSNTYDMEEVWVNRTMTDGTLELGWTSVCKRISDGKYLMNHCSNKGMLSFFNKEVMVFQGKKWGCEKVEPLP